MRILDKYVAKNFFIGYIIITLVFIGLCVLIDLFVNLDEFAEMADEGTSAVVTSILDYYGARCILWFRDLAGIITIVAAVFSVLRMTQSNELIAIMASGVSLKRFMAPIVVLAMGSAALVVLNQELLIPRLAHELTRSHDDSPDNNTVDNVWYMADKHGSLVSTKRFENNIMSYPTFILRKQIPDTLLFEVTDIIRADSASYDAERMGWVLENGTYMQMTDSASFENAITAQRTIDFYDTDITPEMIPLRQQEGYKSLLSYRQLTILEERAIRVRDLAELYMNKHARIADPITNIVMLLIALPMLICRDPKTMKTAILKSFGMISLCFTVALAGKMFATEQFFGRVQPEPWIWAPILIFLPVAFVQLDSMKT